MGMEGGGLTSQQGGGSCPVPPEPACMLWGTFVPVAQRVPLSSDPIFASHSVMALPTYHGTRVAQAMAPTAARPPMDPSKAAQLEGAALGSASARSQFQTPLAGQGRAPSGVSHPRTRPPTPSITSELHLAPQSPFSLGLQSTAQMAAKFPEFPHTASSPPRETQSVLGTTAAVPRTV